MTKLCCAPFKYENERKIGWDNWLTTFYFTPIIWRVEKGDFLVCALSYALSDRRASFPMMEEYKKRGNIMFRRFWGVSWICLREFGYRTMLLKLKPWFATQDLCGENNMRQLDTGWWWGKSQTTRRGRGDENYVVSVDLTQQKVQLHPTYSKFIIGTMKQCSW